jgi:hypothetical protein
LSVPDQFTRYPSEQFCMFALRCVLMFLLTWSAVGFAAPPSIERVTPTVGQRGTTFQLAILGAGLARAEEVLLYRGEVKCTTLTSVSDNELTLTLTAAPDCPPGECAFRIRSPEGISELLTFLVTTLPVVPETEDNNTLESAQVVELNSTIAGVIEAGDTDVFRITLQKGQRLTAEAEAMRAGGGLFDAVLNLYDPNGDWINSADDSALTRQDPYFSLTAPTDGDYLIQIHETSHEGDDDCRYALHLGSFLRPDLAWPPGGMAGTTQSVTWISTAETPVSESLVLPATQAETILLYPSCSECIAPVGVPFRVCPFPNINESVNSDQKSRPQPARLPVAFNGILASDHETDSCLFFATAGQKLRVAVFARQLGSPVDSLLEIRDSSGRVLAASDDAESPDSRIDLVTPRDDVLELRITDKRGNFGPSHFYRIEVTEQKPELLAFIARPDRKSQERQAIAVPRGNRVLTFLSVQRRGFTEDVHLSPGPLPPGLTMSPASVPADRFWVPVLMEASEASPLQGNLVPLEAFASDSSGTITGHFQQVVDLVATSADQLFHQVRTDKLAVAVTEAVPYRVTLEPPVSPLAPDGTLDLHIAVERSNGFSGPLDITFPFLPPWVDGPDHLRIPEGADSGTYTLHAWPNAELRTWSICAEARPALPLPTARPTEPGPRPARSESEQLPVNRIPVASNLVSLTIAQSPASGLPKTIVTEQGQTSTVVYAVTLSDSLPDSLIATLEGLPNRVHAPPVQILSTERRIRFDLEVTSTAPTGSFADLFVRLSGDLNGRRVSWIVGAESSLTIEPTGELLTDENGRPLSRLEALRLRASTPADQAPQNTP